MGSRALIGDRFNPQKVCLRAQVEPLEQALDGALPGGHGLRTLRRDDLLEPPQEAGF